MGTVINPIFVALGGVATRAIRGCSACLAYELIVTLLWNLQAARGRLNEWAAIIEGSLRPNNHIGLGENQDRDDCELGTLC